MRRIIRALNSLLAPLVCAGLVAAWVASYWFVAAIALYSHTPTLHVLSFHRGSMLLFTSSIPVGVEKRLSVDVLCGPAAEFSAAPTASLSVGQDLFDVPNLKLSFAGFRLAHGRLGLPALVPRFTAVTIPHAFLVALAAVPTGLSMRRAIRRRRWRRQGRCTSCGYDLRSSPGRCPECGADAGGPVRGGSV